MSGIIIVIGVGIVVAGFAAFALNVLLPGGDATATEDRLSALARGGRGGDSPVESQSLLLGDMADGDSLWSNVLRNMPGLSEYLAQGDVKIQPAQFAFICLACFGGGIGLCMMTPIPILLGPILGMVFTLLPIGWVFMKRRRRLAKFGVQMPEALELLGRSLRAGHSLQAGFGLVGSEMEAPLAVEFRRCFEEQNLGIPLDEAIEEMSNRIPDMDLRFFATAIVLQRQTGGDLAEILDKIGHLIRERLQIHGQIQALTGEGRMSGAVLLALPPVLFLVMLKMNYEYVMVLFTDEAGRYMLTAALITQVIGALVIKKIITIKV